MDALWKDLKFAVRSWRRTPGVVLLAVVALALGIGASTAVFSVVDAALFRPLPYQNPEQIVSITVSTSHGDFVRRDLGPSYTQFHEMENSQPPSLAALGRYEIHDQALTTPAPAEMMHVGYCSVSLFGLLGVRPALGRPFVSDDGYVFEKPPRQYAGAWPREPVAIISHGLWIRRFAGQRTAIGQQMTLDDVRFTVIGVLPDDFTLGGSVDFWLPAAYRPYTEDTNMKNSAVIGRLQPGARVAQTQSEMDVIASRFREAKPADKASHLSFAAATLKVPLTSSSRAGLSLLLGAVALVLLIACANVAGLLLARTNTRQAEMTVRAALGATPGRIVRQLLTESLALAVVAGALGSLFALWGVDLVLLLLGDQVPRSDQMVVAFRVLLFASVVTLVTGVLCGASSAFTAARPDLHRGLKEGARDSGGKRTHSLRQFLVGAEVALSLVLLIGAALVINSLVHLYRVDAGFKTDRRLTANVFLVAPRGSPLKGGEMLQRFFAQLMPRLRSLPGVQAVGFIDSLPLANQTAPVLYELESQQAQSVPLRQSVADAGYFEAMAIPLRAGRQLGPADAVDRTTALVNDRLARQFWGSADAALGRRLRYGSPGRGPWVTVVGVVGDTRQRSLDEPSEPEIYFPQNAMWGGARTLILSTSGDPSQLITPLRAEVSAVNAAVPVFDVKTLDQVLVASFGVRWAVAWLLAAFAGLALILALVGIYGVTSYSVARRTQEIGVRMALGASEAGIVRMLMVQAMSVVAGGVGVGVAASVLLSRLLGSLLYDIRPTDPATYVGLAVAVALVTLVATLVPARRAARVDVMTALRYE